MSAYQEYEGIKFTDREALVEALCALEGVAGCTWTPEGIKVDKDGKLALYGYSGDNRNIKYSPGDSNYAPLAEICIPGSGHPGSKNLVGMSSNDLGFYRSEDGSLVPIVSSYDSSRYSECWMNFVKAKYLEIVVTKKAKAKGYKVKKKVINGKIKLTLSRWR